MIQTRPKCSIHVLFTETSILFSFLQKLLGVQVYTHVLYCICPCIMDINLVFCKHYRAYIRVLYWVDSCCDGQVLKSG